MSNTYQRTAIFQWNTNGLANKTSAFRQFVHYYNFPVLALCETRVTDQFRLANYVQYRAKRPNGLSRVMLCVRKDLPSSLVSSSTSSSPEYVAVKVRCASFIFTVVSVYLEPQTTVSSSVLNTLFRNLSAPFVVCGDFNAHSPSWGSQRICSRGRLLEEIIERNNLCVLNDGTPTYLRGVGYSSVLDLTLCSSDIASEAP